MQISAALFRPGANDLSIESVEIEAPRADEIRVRMVGTGICHTDMLMMELSERIGWKDPVVFGHEGAGIIEAVGSAVHDLKPGDKVAISLDYCGACPRCMTGHPSYCDQVREINFTCQRRDGSTALSQNGHRVHSHFFAQSSFATHSIVPAKAAVRLDEDVPVEMMGPMGCGLQTGAGAVLNILKPPGGSSFVVFGAGSVGLAGLMAAVAVGCHPVIAIDPVGSRRKLAEEIGASHTLDPATVDVTEAIRSITKGEGAQFALDTTTKVKVIEGMIAAMAPFGKCSVVGVEQAGGFTLNMAPVMRGITVHGVMEGDSVPRLFIPQMIDMWRRGDLPFDRMIRYYRFADINQAMRDSLEGSAIKPVLRFD